jgi:hypothetical protein
MTTRLFITPPRTRFLVGLVLLFGAMALRAQVPQLISYQGRVAIHGTNFNGIGQFKFALVNSNASVTFWSNNGTSSGGNEPLNPPVPLAVSKGLYSVRLGDTTLSTNMTPIPATVFTNSDVRLRIWFSEGTYTELLSPDQRLAPVGYAMVAATVPADSITSAKIAAGAVGTAQLADSAVTSGKIAGGAVFPYHFAGGNFVPSGGMILSSNYNDGYLLGAGFLKARLVQLSDGTFMYLYRKP